MVGYVGERARRRRRRIIFVIFLIIISLIIIYFSNSVYDEKIEINNKIDATDSAVEKEQLSINREEFELKIIEKEQKIVFRDHRIISLKKQLNILTEEKNDLIKEKNYLLEENKKLLVSLDTLNSKIENNLQIKEDAVKEKVKEFNLVILQLKKENEKILNEYEDVFKKNLELDLQLKSLNIEKMEIKSLNIEKMGKISQLEQVINEQKEIIESLKDKNPH